MQSVKMPRRKEKLQFLKIAVVLVRKGNLVGLFQLLSVLLHHSFVDCNLWWGQRRRLNEEQVGITDQLFSKPLLKNLCHASSITEAMHVKCDQETWTKKLNGNNPFLEWLFKLIIRPGRDFVVLKILFAMEVNLLGFDFAILHIHLSMEQNDQCKAVAPS
jgi:hypothetical protein